MRGRRGKRSEVVSTGGTAGICNRQQFAIIRTIGYAPLPRRFEAAFDIAYSVLSVSQFWLNVKIIYFIKMINVSHRRTIYRLIRRLMAVRWWSQIGLWPVR